MRFDDPTPLARPATSLRLHRTRDLLGRELGALLRPEVADRILSESIAEAASDPHDPSARLRCLVGARLLEAVSDLLARAAKDETPLAQVTRHEPRSAEATRCVQRR